MNGKCKFIRILIFYPKLVVRGWRSPLGLIPEKEIENEIHIVFCPIARLVVE